MQNAYQIPFSPSWTSADEGMTLAMGEYLREIQLMFGHVTNDTDSTHLDIQTATYHFSLSPRLLSDLIGPRSSLFDKGRPDLHVWVPLGCMWPCACLLATRIGPARQASKRATNGAIRRARKANKPRSFLLEYRTDTGRIQEASRQEAGREKR